MGFDWKKYLELAEYITDNADNLPDKEACYRASVSRAYYAAFCITRGYIRKSDGQEYKGGEAHQKIVEHLQTSSDQRKRAIANHLKALRKDRNKADYDDNISREKPRNMAFKATTMSKTIISKINELSAR